MVMNIPAALVSTKDLVGNKHAPATFPVPIPGTVTALSFSKLLSDRSGATDKVRPSDDKPRPANPVKQADPRDTVKDPRDREPRSDTAYGDNRPVARQDDGGRTRSERAADDSKVPAKDGRDTLDADPQTPADAKSAKPGSSDKPQANRSGDAATSPDTSQAADAATGDVGVAGVRGAGAIPVVAQATAANATTIANANGLSQALTSIAGAAATQAVVAVQTAATGNRGNANGNARPGLPGQAAPVAMLASGAVDPNATATVSAVGADQGQEAATGLLNPTQTANAGDGATVAKGDLAQIAAGQQSDATAGSGKTDTPSRAQSPRTTPAFDRNLADLTAGRTGDRPGGAARARHAAATTAQQLSQPQAPQSQGSPQGQTNGPGPTVAVPVTAQPQDRGDPTATRGSIDPLKVDGSVQSQSPSGPGNSTATAPDPLRGATQARAAQHPTMGHPAAEQVAVRIQKAISEGNDRIHIRLKPAALGRVDVKLEVTHDGRVMAVVTTDNANTLNMLKQDSRGLTQALQDAGLKADSNSLSFNLQGGNHGGAGSFDGGFGNHGRTAGDGNAPLTADRDAVISENITPYRILGNGLLDIHV